MSQQKITITKYPNNPTAQFLGVLSTMIQIDKGMIPARAIPEGKRPAK